MGFAAYVLNTYSKTGSLPDTPFFQRLEKRWEANPTRFEANHPILGALMEDAECPGLLPQEGIFNLYRDRYELNPERFTKYHPFWGKLFDREKDALEKCQTCNQPPTIPPPVLPPPYIPCIEPPPPISPPINPVNPIVPEPSTSILVGLGLITLLIVHRWNLKKKAIRSNSAKSSTTMPHNGT